jgi:hypothetical protein
MSTAEALRADPLLAPKAAFFEAFWRGEGPCPILFARPHLALGKNYDAYNLREQHADPEKLMSEALGQAMAAMESGDDGIPVVRPDLGTTLFPSALGLRLAIAEELHPSLAEHMPLESYARMDIAALDLRGGEIPLADALYRLLRVGQEAGRIPAAIRPYLPDNQGIFDLTHLAVGSDIFYAFTDSPDTLIAAQERSLELFLALSRHFKDLIGEDPSSMVHGHGMPSGVWFPDTGIRISEDSCTLVSGADIRKYCLPFIERAIAPFGRGFLHFCGAHEDFLRMACESPLVSTLNLGNPDYYDLGELMALCGRTGTTYFGHLPREGAEQDEAYLERLADMAARTGCRLILVAPEIADRAASLRRWHRLTRA